MKKKINSKKVISCVALVLMIFIFLAFFFESLFDSFAVLLSLADVVNRDDLFELFSSGTIFGVCVTSIVYLFIYLFDLHRLFILGFEPKRSSDQEVSGNE